MGRKHDRTTPRYLTQVVDEYNTEILESIDDDFVVHDLVIAVDGCVKCAHHPRECLDRHFYTCTKTTGRCENNFFDVIHRFEDYLEDAKVNCAV